MNLEDTAKNEEKKGNYSEASNLRKRIADPVGAERNAKKSASIAKYGMVVQDYVQRFQAGRDYW